MELVFAIVNMRDEVLWLNPRLPDELQEFRLRIRYRGHWLRLRATHDTLTVSFEQGGSGPAQIGFQETFFRFSEDDRREFALCNG